MWLSAQQTLTPGEALAALQMWTPVVIAAFTLAATALATAVATWHRVGSNSARLTVVERTSKKRSTDTSVAPLVAVVPPGGASTPVPAVTGVGGIWYPPWSQLRDANPDGSLPVAATTDCGWECVAMIVRVCRGVEVEADYLRYLDRGPAGAGWSTPAQLVAMLHRFRFADARALTEPAPTVVDHVSDQLGAGRPVLALGHFLDAEALHWVALSAVGPSKVAYEDPWYGTRRVATSAEFWAQYAGAVVNAGERAVYAL